MKHLEELKNSKNFEEVIENVKKIKKDWKTISEDEREQIIRFDSCLNFDIDDKLSVHLDDVAVISPKDNVYGAVEMYEDGIKKITNKVSFTESLSIVVPTGVRYFDEKFKSVENNTSTEATTSTEEPVKTTEQNVTPTSTEEDVKTTEDNTTTPTSQKQK